MLHWAQRTLIDLLYHGLNNRRMTVSLVASAEHANEIEIFFAIHVLHITLVLFPNSGEL